MTFKPQHISVSINAPSDAVYKFASNPENLPQWASGLGESEGWAGDEWVVDSPMGKIRLRFAEQNAYGVLDHVATLASGQSFNNPMRVIANGEGSEVIFTLFKLPQMTEEEFRKDADTIQKDLNSLKRLLESGASLAAAH